MRKIDRSDLTKYLGKLNTDQFCIEMHKRLVEETEIVENDKSEFDIIDINRVLARFPQYYSWIIVEAELIAREYEKLKLEYDIWYKRQYTEAVETLERIKSRPTIAQIEAEVISLNEYQMFSLSEQYKAQGKSQKEIDELMKYKGFRGWKMRLMDYETATNVAKGLVKVWGSTINSLQSLSRNIAIEADIIKRQKGI